MSRVINRDTEGNQRDRLLKMASAALGEFFKSPQPGEKSRDQAAFVALALMEVDKTIEPSAQAWEKRGYWVKADRYRLDWEWTARLGKRLAEELQADHWDGVQQTMVEAAQHLATVRASTTMIKKEPWKGSWEQLSAVWGAD